MSNTLSNPPLIEALLEIKWKLTKDPQGFMVDAGFDIAHIRLAQELQGKFEVLESLPAAQLPSQISSHVMKYRYRIAKDSWPLIQIGPGIASLNFTKPYNWEDFKVQAKIFISSLKKAYSDDEFELTSIALRYINGQNFDYSKENIFDFMQSNLHTLFKLPDSILDSVSAPPSSALWALEFPIAQPKGIAALKFATGVQIQDEIEKESTLWEIIVQSIDNDTPQVIEDNDYEIFQWLNDAHDIVEKWFFILIEGELLTKYR